MSDTTTHVLELAQLTVKPPLRGALNCSDQLPPPSAVAATTPPWSPWPEIQQCESSGQLMLVMYVLFPGIEADSVDQVWPPSAVARR